MKKIVLTGGGTAGHVTPNIALLPSLREDGFEVIYIGSHKGIEKRLCEEAGITYKSVSTGLFRRYFDLKNFTDPFRVLRGIKEARQLLSELRPDVIFSKGGFVGVPVVLGARKHNIPCIIHESDISPGLANKISMPFATRICCNFPETVNYIKNDNIVVTGSPIRKELLQGSKEEGLRVCGFDGSKKVLMVIGGSQGAGPINDVLRECLPKLLPTYDIVHICGKDKVDNLMLNIKGYKQFEYVGDELKDIYAMAEMVISRAGANSIAELLALKKPNLLIPLSLGSRGDQIQNAASYAEQGFSMVIREEALDPAMFVGKIQELDKDRDRYIEQMESKASRDPISAIMDIINETIRNSKADGKGEKNER